MFGNIIYISDTMAHVKLLPNSKIAANLMNVHVVFEDGNSRILGEISDIDGEKIKVNFLGEFDGNKFNSGILRKPTLSSRLRLINKEELAIIIGVDKKEGNLFIGKSVLYNGYPICVSTNDLFSNHMAIFGNTGSGKSCGVARIFQNLFSKEHDIAYKASIFIFDAYGEYHDAFRNLSNVVPEISLKTYTTNLKTTDSEILRIPVWLLSLDDIALLLDATSHNQIPIIEKAMKLVTIFAREEELVIKHKNDIIARAILDILSSGKSPVQIRDQIFSILSIYNTKELNLESTVYQPGYSRSLKNCFIIDNTGKIREMELISNFMESFLDDTLELEMPDGSFKYDLKDLKKALDFALISEGVLNSEKIYDETNILKVRLHSLVNSDENTYFDYPEYITKEEYIRSLMVVNGNRKAQIINFNINYVDDRFAKVLTKIYSKLLFDYSKELKVRASFPIHIILEEAHRYVQNDNDVNLLGYNIFERIAKEGRKYGIILGLITQRPSELSNTAISQCNNFLIFKMQHPLDIDYIRDMVPNITSEIIKKLKILPAGTCMAFGLAFKVPVLIKLKMPDPAPASSNCDISSNWFVRK